MRVLWFVLAACASPELVEESSIVVAIELRSHEPPSRPPPSQTPLVYIDDVETSTFERTYSSLDEARSEMHRVELRHGSTVLRARDVSVTSTCVDQTAPTKSVTYSLCLYESGDLRFSFVEARGEGKQCIGDGFCTTCMKYPCPSGERCTSRVTSIDPPASHLACAPIGTKQLGEACGLIADAEGAYDDCGETMLCVGGVCRATCLALGGFPQQCPSCQWLPGHAPELMVCP